MLNVECCVCDVSSAKVSWWLHTLAVMCVCICVHMCCLQFVCCLCEICGATKRTLLCCFLSLRLLFFFFFYNSLQALSVVVAALMAVMVGLCAGRSSSLRSSSLRSTVYSLQSSVGSLHSLLFSQVSVPWQKITQFEIRGAG